MKRRLAKWSTKPWIMPDFLKQKKTVFVGRGNYINVDETIDRQRMEECKSKKAKGVYALMKTLKAGDAQSSYSKGINLLGSSISTTSYRKGIRLLEKKDNLLDDDDDFYGGKSKKKGFEKDVKEMAMNSFMNTVISLNQPGAAGGQAGAMTGENTGNGISLREMLEERDEQMKDDEQLADI